MFPLFRRCVKISKGIDSFAHAVGHFFQERISDLLTLEKLFYFWISKGSFIDSNSRQTGRCALLLPIQCHNSGDADHREVPMTQNKLLKGPSS